MNAVELWQKTCSLLIEDTPSSVYNTWIATLFPLKLEDNVLYLQADDAVVVRMFKSFYRTIVNTALAEVTGRAMNAEISLPKGTQPEPQTQTRKVQPSMPLNAKYTFETFVVGGANRFAHAASLAVAEMPAQAYNPLFIYGGVGLGKTHLMHAIGHYVKQLYPTIEVTYITGENFTNGVIMSIQQNKTAEFRDRFRNADILLVDDIQFIAGRDSTQEEFFHTFNALHSAGKQIVLTSDRPPKDIARLEERLRSRFEWGLSCDIQRPDIETRIAILRRKAQSEHIIVQDDVLTMIAEKVDSNIRELEGSLTRLCAYSTLNGGAPITLSLAQEALADVFAQKELKRVTCRTIQEAVANYYSITMDDIIGARRNREVVVPRQVAMYLTREMLGMSLPKIGDAFGGRDHSTVLNGCQKIQETLRSSPSFTSLVNDIRKMIER